MRRAAAALVAAVTAGAASWAAPRIALSDPVQVSADLAGRPLPAPDADRPLLDDALLPYIPCRRLPAATRAGSAPAILPDLSRRWAAGFAAIHAGVLVQLPPPFEGPQGKLSSTLRRFLAGDLPFAFLSREMTATDRLVYRRAHGHDPIVVPVARGSFRHFGFVDPVVIVVNAENPLAGLSYAQIDAIYSGTRLRGEPRARSWGDLGVIQAGWQKLPIRALGGGREGHDDSAKASIVRSRILARGGVQGRWHPDLEVAGADDDSVVAQVAADRGAIGIAGLAHLIPGVRAIAVARDDVRNMVPPTRERIFDGSYPLARTIDLVFGRTLGGTVDPVILEFARYLLGREAQSIVLRQGVFLPLDRATYRQSAAHLATLAPCGG